LETIQGGADLYNHITISLKVRQRTEVGALMILDEIQPGFDAQENSFPKL
jgi:acetylornithine/succinyldiaminopimelate/putrescine aminotransferase